MLATPHPKVSVARARSGCDELWLKRLNVWLESQDAPARTQLMDALAALLPEYRPTLKTPLRNNVRAFER
jgi:hypothetical protein